MILIVFVCLFVLAFSSHSRIFHSYGDTTITGIVLQILTYGRRSWPLSSEDNLACHIYFDTGHPFIRSSPRIHDTHTYCRALSSRALAISFYDLGLMWLGFEPNMSWIVIGPICGLWEWYVQTKSLRSYEKRLKLLIYNADKLVMMYWHLAMRVR